MKRGVLHGVAVALVGAAGIGAAGCGGDDGGDGDEGLAAAVPADVPIYVEGNIRPDDEEAAAIESIASRFPGGEDLGETLIAEIDASLAEEAAESGGEELTFEEDFEPWLGERAAAFDTRIGGEGEEGTVLLEVSDEDQARETVERQAESGPEEEETREAGGSEYLVDEDRDAVAVADGRMIIGPEESVVAALEAADGGGLAGTDGYEAGVESVGGEDALAFAHVSLPPWIEAATDETSDASDFDAESLRRIVESSGIDLETPFALAATAEGDRLVLESSLGLDIEGADLESAGLFGELPADSAVAAGAGVAGEYLAESYEEGFRTAGEDAGATEAEIEAAEENVRSSTGFDPPALLRALGPMGFFVRGPVPEQLQFGAVFEVADRAAVEEAIAGVRSTYGAGAGSALRDLSGVPDAQDAFVLQVPGAELQVEVAYTGDRLAVSGGAPGGVTAALGAPERLGDSDHVADLKESVGAEPSFLIDVPKLLGLFDATLAREPDYAEVEPYLAPLDLVGSGAVGDRDGLFVTRAVITFSDAAAAVPDDSAEGETETEPEAEEESAETTTIAPTSGAAAEANIRDTLRAFNRAVNLGKAQQACNNYFSQAFLSRLRTERECANSLAAARRGEGRAQLEVTSVLVDEDEGTASARVRVGIDEGVVPDLEDLRDVDLIYEDGAWKIDAVTVPFG